MLVYLVSCLDRSVCGLLQQYCFGSDVACYVLLFMPTLYLILSRGITSLMAHSRLSCNDYYSISMLGYLQHYVQDVDTCSLL
jgi:hypothetical protein